MPEQEELTLVVTLDDRASAQLGNLRSTLSTMAQNVSQAGAGIHASTGKAAAGVGQLHTGLMGLVAKGTFIGHVLGQVTTEFSKLGAQAVSSATDFEGLAREMTNTSNAARLLGTSTAQLRQNFQSFREAGVPIDQAQKAIEGLTESFVDLQMVNSRLRPQLMRGNFLPIDEMAKFVDMMQEVDDPDKLAGVVKQGYDAVMKYNAQFGPAVQAREGQRYLAVLKAQGIERIDHLKKASEYEKQLNDEREAGNAQWIKTTAVVNENYERMGRSLGSIAIGIINASGAGAAWEKWTDGVAKRLEDIEKRLRTAKETADAAAEAPGFWGQLNPFNPANVKREQAVAPELKQFPGMTPENLATPGGVPQMAMGGRIGGRTAVLVGESGPELFVPDGSGTIIPSAGGGGGGLLPDSDDSVKATQENTKELSRLNDYLEFRTQQGGLAPGLGGGSFRFPGGGSGPGIGSGGGTTDSSGAATFGGGAGGGAAGTGGGAAGGNFDPMGGGDPNLTGNEFLKSQRARFGQELQANPEIKQKLAALVAKENPGAGTAVVESLMNRMAYTGGSINRGMHSGFYGPINRGQVRWTGSAQQQAMMRHIDEALAGSNIIKGATDQGSGRDPNVGWQGGRMVINGEVFNDWGGGPGGHGGAARFREQQQARVAGTASTPIYNPPGGAAPGVPGGGAGSFAPGGAGVAGGNNITAAQAGVKPLWDTGKANIGGLNAEFVSRLNAAYSAMTPEQQASMRHAYASGGHRTRADQERIWRESAGGTRFAAAPPGHSRHEGGMAVDVQRGPALTFLQTQGHRFGLEGIMGGLGGRDPVHIQQRRGDTRQYYAGQQTIPANAQYTQGQGVPVNVVNMTPQAAQQYVEAQQKANASVAKTAAEATAAAVKAGATPEVAAAAGAAAARASAEKTAEEVKRTTGQWPSQQKREEEDATRKAEALTEKERLEKRIRDYEHRDDRERARTRRTGTGTEPAGTREGAAPRPAGDVPTPRRDPRYPRGGRYTPLSGGDRERTGLPGTEKEYRKAYEKAREAENERDKEAVKKLTDDEAIRKQAEFDRQVQENLKERNNMIDRSVEDETKDSEQRAKDTEQQAQIARDRANALSGRPGGYVKPAATPSGTGDSTTGYSSAAGKALDTSGRALDSANDVKVTADGTLKVDVKAAKGTSVAAKGEGAFKKTIVTRQRQMEPASSGPDHDPDLDS